MLFEHTSLAGACSADRQSRSSVQAMGAWPPPPYPNAVTSPGDRRLARSSGSGFLHGFIMHRSWGGFELALCTTRTLSPAICSGLVGLGAQQQPRVLRTAHIGITAT